MSMVINPVPGVPVVRPADDLAAQLLSSLEHAQLALTDGDILVVCQKVVSKAEGRIARIADVTRGQPE